MPIIFITGYGDILMTVRAMKEGALEFLTKPCEGARGKVMQKMKAASHPDLVKMAAEIRLEPAPKG
jgi:FixJ family two-component response regulator